MNLLLAYKPEHNSVLIKAIQGIDYVYFSNGDVIKDLRTELNEENLPAFIGTLQSRGFRLIELNNGICRKIK